MGVPTDVALETSIELLGKMEAKQEKQGEAKRIKLWVSHMLFDDLFMMPLLVFMQS